MGCLVVAMASASILRWQISDPCWMLKNSNKIAWVGGWKTAKRGRMRASGANNRRSRTPLQKGRYLSIEAIQTVQALKWAQFSDPEDAALILRERFSRLLKLDMIAVLRELLRQNQCHLSMKVFEEIRKEDWYKPRASLYEELVKVMAENGQVGQAKALCGYLRKESGALEANQECEGFQSLIRTLIANKLPALALDCYDMMILIGCEPSRDTFTTLIIGLRSLGEIEASQQIRNHACSCYYGFHIQEQET